MARGGMLVVGAVLGVLAGCGVAAARGYWSGGVYIGVPPVVISPYPHYPPAPYHARPAASEGCYAGPYVCPLEAHSVVGMPCSCPTVQGPAWGRAR